MLATCSAANVVPCKLRWLQSRLQNHKFTSMTTQQLQIHKYLLTNPPGAVVLIPCHCWPSQSHQRANLAALHKQIMLQQVSIASNLFFAAKMAAKSVVNTPKTMLQQVIDRHLAMLQVLDHYLTCRHTMRQHIEGHEETVALYTTKHITKTSQKTPMYIFPPIPLPWPRSCHNLTEPSGFNCV